MNSGVISLNGVPGSGKTLTATNIALKHYKKQNSLMLKYISYLKYLLNKLLFKNKFIDSIKNNKFYIKFNDLDLIIFIKNEILSFPIIGKILRNFSTLDYEYYKLFPYEKINTIYSTYPILLDKKKKIYSNKVNFYDLTSSFSFYPDTLIIIDEIQLFVDSDEYKDKEKNKILSRVAKFLQSHRHFGIKQIIFTSQHPSRIFKKGRNIITWYIKLKKIINIPFLPISIIRGIAYEDFEFYGRYIPRDREERKKLPFEYHKITRLFNRYKVYNSYDSRYLSMYNYSMPLLDFGSWDNRKVDYNYLSTLFEEK